MSVIDLSDVQGNILKGFNKPNVRLIFFKFDDPYETMKWLKDLAERIPNTIDLINASNNFYERRRNDPYYESQETWLHVSLSETGVDKLGLEPPPSRGIYEGIGLKTTMHDPDPTMKYQDPFAQGMKARHIELGDVDGANKNDPKNWVEPYRTKAPHCLVIVAGDQDDDVGLYTSKLIHEATKVGSVCVGLEIGKAIENEQGKQVEHFGFRDGVSQPLIAGVDLPTSTSGPRIVKTDNQKRKNNPDKFYPQDFVLSGFTGKFEPTYGYANNGSFLVFRRLRQNVPAFWQFMSECEKHLQEPPEKIAATIVGRWKSGAPLATYDSSDPVAPDFSDDNDFVYLRNRDTRKAKNDPIGERTATFAHIRLANPRDSKPRDMTHGNTSPTANIKENAKHKILRRGIPYGPTWAKQNRKMNKVNLDQINREADRGLLFICFQRDIEMQFEEMQKQWSFYENYPLRDPAASVPDPHAKLKDLLVKEGSKGGFEKFVTTTGGGYFFSPSISGLKNLAKYSTRKLRFPENTAPNV
jgi:Dyp-type peroxidase family